VKFWYVVFLKTLIMYHFLWISSGFSSEILSELHFPDLRQIRQMT
jgi:hypothetical protein